MTHKAGNGMDGNWQYGESDLGRALESQLTLQRIDLELLEELLECLGDADFKSALEKFESDVASALDDLLEAADAQATRRAAHRMKGLFGQFGAVGVTALAARVEVGKQEPQEVQILVQEARRSSQAVLDIGNLLIAQEIGRAHV